MPQDAAVQAILDRIKSNRKRYSEFETDPQKKKISSTETPSIEDIKNPYAKEQPTNLPEQFGDKTARILTPEAEQAYQERGNKIQEMIDFLASDNNKDARLRLSELVYPYGEGNAPTPDLSGGIGKYLDPKVAEDIYKNNDVIGVQKLFNKIEKIQNAPKEKIDATQKGKNKLTNFILATNLYKKPISEVVQSILEPIFVGSEKVEEGKSKITKGILTGDLKEIGFGAGESAGGSLDAAISLIPGVIGLNATMPVINSLAASTSEKLGFSAEDGERVAGIIAPFLFGKWVGLGSLANTGTTEGIKQTGVLDKLSPQDQQIAYDLIGNLAFFGTAIGGRRLSQKYYEKIQRDLAKELFSEESQKNIRSQYEPLDWIVTEFYGRNPSEKLKKLMDMRLYEKEGFSEAELNNIDTILRKGGFGDLVDYLSKIEGTFVRAQTEGGRKLLKAAQKSKPAVKPEPKLDEEKKSESKSVEKRAEPETTEQLVKRIPPEIKTKEDFSKWMTKEEYGFPESQTVEPIERDIKDYPNLVTSFETKNKNQIDIRKAENEQTIYAFEGNKEIGYITNVQGEPELTVSTSYKDQGINEKLLLEYIKQNPGTLSKGGFGFFLPQDKGTIENLFEQIKPKEQAMEAEPKVDPEKVLKDSGIAADYKGIQKTTKKGDYAVYDIVVDPNNPNPALRKTGTMIKLDELTPETLKAKADEVIKKFEPEVKKRDQQEKKTTVTSGLKNKTNFDSYYNKLPDEIRSKLKNDYIVERDEIVNKYYGKNNDKTSLSSDETLAYQKELNELSEKYIELAKSELNKKRKTTPKKLRKKKRIGTKKQVIQDVSLKNIVKREEDFQGRPEPFSQDTFKRIVLGKLQTELDEGNLSEKKLDQMLDAANTYLNKNHPKPIDISKDDLSKENTFNWSEFGQITLWEEPKTQKKILLSGHSRSAAADFLSEFYDDFKDLPSQIQKGISLEEAKKIALSSNIKGTREPITSDAMRLRNLREKGATKKKIEATARIYYGRDAQRIINLSHLNPDGNTMIALKQSPTDSTIQSIADWVGDARANFDMLTDAHEDELFKFLMNKKIFKNRIKNKVEFRDAIERRTSNIEFNPDLALNIAQTGGKSKMIKEFDEKVESARKALRDAQNTLEKKRQYFISSGKTGDVLTKLLRKYDDDVNLASRELADLVKNKQDIYLEDSRQIHLFGEQLPQYKKDYEKSVKWDKPDVVKDETLPIRKISVNKDNTEFNRDRKSIVKSSNESMQQQQINSKDFRNWFNGSKITDTNGKPLKVFADSKNILFSSSEKNIENTTPVYLRIQKPVVIGKGTMPETYFNVGNDVDIHSGFFLLKENMINETVVEIDSLVKETDDVNKLAVDIKDSITSDIELDPEIVKAYIQKEIKPDDLRKHVEAKLTEKLYDENSKVYFRISDFARSSGLLTEPDGMISKILDSTQKAAAKFTDSEMIRRELINELGDSIVEGISASKLDSILQTIIAGAYRNEFYLDGKNIAKDVIRDIYNRAGFDGIIKQGDISEYSVWFPNQIKGAIDNEGKYQTNFVNRIKEDMFSRSTNNGNKDSVALMNLKDRKRHLHFVLNEIKGKSGFMPAARKSQEISYATRRAEINEELEQIDKQIEKLEKKLQTAADKKIAKVQLDMFGSPASTMEANTNAKVKEALNNHINNLQQDLEIFENSENKKPDKIESVKEQIDLAKKILSKIDDTKAALISKLNPEQRKQYDDISLQVDDRYTEFNQLLKVKPDLFNSPDHAEKLEKAKELYLNSIDRLERFVLQNTIMPNETKGTLRIQEQLQLDFQIKKKQFSNIDAPEYNGKKFIHTEPSLKKLDPGEVCFAERRFKKYKQLQFFAAKEKIESMDDVVYLMNQLEDESVESAFIVHITDKGKPVVQHISTGSYTSAIVDQLGIVDLTNRLKTKEIYFIHNHPSGNLRASREDINTWHKIYTQLKPKGIILHPGVIIDVRNGKYGYFDMQSSTGATAMKKISSGENIPVPVLTFGKTKYVEPNYIGQLPTTDDVAIAITKARYGVGDKTHVYIMSTDKKVYARLFIRTPIEDINSVRNAGIEISDYISRFNGIGAILVSNWSDKDKLRNMYGHLERTVKNNGGQMLLAVGVDPQKQGKLSYSDLVDIGVSEHVDKNVGRSIINENNRTITFTKNSREALRLSEPSESLTDPEGKSRLNKYLEKIMDSMPPEIAEELRNRLNDLEEKEKLSPEEKKERTELRKKKNKIYSQDPFIRRRLSTDIKNKIRNVQIGANIGAAEKQKKINDLKSTIAQYARMTLPKYQFTKGEVTPLLTKISNAKTVEDASEAFQRIREIEERSTRRKYLSDINKIIKKADPKKGDAEIVLFMKKIRRMKPENVEEAIAKIYRNAANRDLDETEDIQVYLLHRYSNIHKKSAEELADLYQELEEAFEKGRSRRREHLAKEKERQEGLKEKILEVVTGGEGVKDTDIARSEGLDKEKESMLKRLSGYDSMMHSWEIILDKLSKHDKKSEPLHSFLNEYFAHGIYEARNALDKGTRENLDMVRQKLFEVYGTTNSLKLMHILSGNSKRQKTGAFKTVVLERDEAGLPSKTKQVELELSQNEAAKKLMEYEDESLAETFENMGYTKKTIEQLREYIDPRVLKWSQWQLDEFYPDYHSGISRIYQQIRGVPLTKTPKYSPIQRSVSQNVTDSDFLGDNFTEFVSMINGHLQPRVSNTHELKKLDMDQVLLEHIVTMEHFKAFAPIMKDLRSVFNDKRIREAIIQYHGATTLKIINRFINDFARGGVDRAMTINLIDKIRANVVRSLIGVNPVVTIKQLTSIPAYAMDIPASSFAKGFGEFMLVNPIGKARFLYNNSEMLKARYTKGWERDIRLAMQRSRKTSAKELSKSGTLTDAIMSFTKFGDAGAIFSGGYSVYIYHFNKAKKAGKNDAEAKKIGIREFEKSTKRAQQASDVEDLGELQRQGSWQKLFTMFMTAPKQYYSNMSMALRNLFTGRGGKYKNLKRLMIAHFVLPSLFQWASNAFQWDWEDQFRAAALGSLNGLLIAGDILESAFAALQGDTYFAWETTPVSSAANHFINGLALLNRWTESNYLFFGDFLDAADELAKAGSGIFGIPYEPVSRLIVGWNDAISDPESINGWKLLGYSDYALRLTNQEVKLDTLKIINAYEREIKRLKEDARKTLSEEDMNKVYEAQQELDSLKRNSLQYQNYLQQKREKRKDDPFAPQPKPPKSKLGKSLMKRPGL